MSSSVFVTGADRGLGLALVEELIARSYRVFAGGYLPDHPELDDLAAAHGGQLFVLPLDVTDDESTAQAARFIAERADSLDVLINNAGIAVDRSRTLLEPLYFDDMRRIMETNAFGALRVTKSVLDLLLRSERKVLVNVSSMAASIGTITRSTQYGYTMSKAAINMQSKLIRNHFADAGLHVIAVHPGAMPTLILGDPEITKNAPVQPAESARGIVNLIENPPEKDGPLFVDYLGEPIPF